jgi:hypothetical protein
MNYNLRRFRDTKYFILAFYTHPHPIMSRNSKRPRLQTTVASDITPRRQFTHSSNTATRTRQIVTPVQLETTVQLIDMVSEPYDSDFPATVEQLELDLPAGIEVLTKRQRYVNSVCQWRIF